MQAGNAWNTRVASTLPQEVTVPRTGHFHVALWGCRAVVTPFFYTNTGIFFLASSLAGQCFSFRKRVYFQFGASGHGGTFEHATEAAGAVHPPRRSDTPRHSLKRAAKRRLELECAFKLPLPRQLQGAFLENAPLCCVRRGTSKVPLC